MHAQCDSVEMSQAAVKHAASIKSTCRNGHFMPCTLPSAARVHNPLHHFMLSKHALGDYITRQQRAGTAGRSARRDTTWNEIFALGQINGFAFHTLGM